MTRTNSLPSEESSRDQGPSTLSPPAPLRPPWHHMALVRDKGQLWKRCEAPCGCCCKEVHWLMNGEVIFHCVWCNITLITLIHRQCSLEGQDILRLMFDREFSGWSIFFVCLLNAQARIVDDKTCFSATTWHLNTVMSRLFLLSL